MFGRKQQSLEDARDRLQLAISQEVGELQRQIFNLSDKVKTLTGVIQREADRSDKLADRLVQMAMVNKGHAREALGIGRGTSSAPQQEESGRNDWGDGPDNDEEWISYPG